jgi:hypothetical protein
MTSADYTLAKEVLLGNPLEATGRCYDALSEEVGASNSSRPCQRTAAGVGEITGQL